MLLGNAHYLAGTKRTPLQATPAQADYYTLKPDE